MGKIAAFITYQYAYGNTSISDDFYELNQYMVRHHLALENIQMIISGRVCSDLKVGDVLISTKGTIIHIKAIHLYGNYMNNVDAGMTCGLIVNAVEEIFNNNEQLFKV